MARHNKNQQPAAETESEPAIIIMLDKFCAAATQCNGT